MKRVSCTLVAALLSATSCAHATKVEGTKEGEHAAGGGREEPKEQGSSPESTPTRVPPRAGRPAVASSPAELMQPGSARRIQVALRGRGYLDQASGQLDRATSAAIRRFQHDQDLAETGAPDRETLRRLGVDPSTVYQTTGGAHDEGTGATQR